MRRLTFLCVVLLACGDTAACPDPTVRIDGRCVFPDAGENDGGNDSGVQDSSVDTSLDSETDAGEGDAAMGDTSVADGCEPVDETCNGMDDDCDGVTDETVLLTFYIDADGDGRGDAERTCEACSVDDCPAPGPWVASGDDCNDDCMDCAPGFTEACDGLDNDCDEMADEGLLTTYYRDGDGDGFGVTAISRDECTQPVGFVEMDGDCADTDRDAFPGQTQYFDEEVSRAGGGFDYNCNMAEEREIVASGTPECSAFSCPGTARWSGSVPGCGDTGTVWFCNDLPAGCLGPIEDSQVMRCR